MIPDVVELQVGDRPGRAADRLPVHPADEADQPLRPRVEAEDLGPLVVELVSVDGHEADVIGPRVQADPPQPLGVDSTRVGARLGSSEADHAGVVIKLGHSALLILSLAGPGPGTTSVTM